MKCSNCGARWEARNEPTAILESEADEPEAPPAQSPAPEPAAAEAEAPAAAAPEIPPDDIEIVPAEPAVEAGGEPDAEPEPVRRAPARPAATAKGEAKGKVAVWASAAALIAALVAGAIAFRGEVVRLWPRSQAAYAGLGLPVNRVGLVIEAVHAEPTFLGGRPVLSVTGAIRNVKGEAVNAPPLRVNLLDRAGKPIAAKVVRPVDPRVPAGAVRHFAIAISDPPSNAHDLEVVFELAPEHAAAAPAASANPAPADPPAEAQPLPAGAPDALPDHG